MQCQVRYQKSIFVGVYVKQNPVFETKEASYMFRLKVKPTSGYVQWLEIYSFTAVIITYSN